MEKIKVGIDIGGTKILLIAKKEEIIVSGAYRRYRCQFHTGSDFSPSDAETIIANFIEKLPEPPISIGIAIPGLVDSDGRVVACDVLPKICGWFPSARFSKICPVRVLNDAESALFEAIHGLEPDVTAAVIMVGTGIGAGFYVNGQVLRGTSVGQESLVVFPSLREIPKIFKTSMDWLVVLQFCKS
jgi:predicted NBD/HSP70 family sugar kinase